MVRPYPELELQDLPLCRSGRLGSRVIAWISHEARVFGYQGLLEIFRSSYCACSIPSGRLQARLAEINRKPGAYRRRTSTRWPARNPAGRGLCY